MPASGLSSNKGKVFIYLGIVFIILVIISSVFFLNTSRSPEISKIKKKYLSHGAYGIQAPDKKKEPPKDHIEKK